MMAKKIIPCLDVKDGRVVKGVKFEGVREVQDPVAMAELYCARGADELVFYDITANIEGRGVFGELLKAVAAKTNVPLMVAGNIGTIDDCERVFGLGADKVSINSGAINNPKFVEEAATKYGKERIVLSMDVKRTEGRFGVFTKGGKVDTGIDAIDWAARCESMGGGALVVNSIDTDGVQGGFDIELLRAVSNRVSIPIIASGGAGKMEDFKALFTELPEIAAGLAASIFHFGQVDIRELKEYLKAEGINVHI